MKILTILSLLFYSALNATEWTAIFYLDGDNDLSSACQEVLNTLSHFGYSSDVKIVALVDYLNSPPAVYEILSGEKRILLSLLEKDLTDLDFFSEFVRFVRDNYPARRYMLVFYDHGNGWYPELSPLIRRAILYDASSGNSVGVAGGELRTFLERAKTILGKEIDIIGFDACLMGEIEVLSEIKTVCQVCLASPSLIPIDAWDYAGLLDTLEKNPKIANKELGKIWVELIKRKGSEGVYAAYDLVALRRINLKKMTEEIEKKGKGTLREKRRICQTYPLQERPPSPTDGHIDLIHFLTLLGMERELADVILTSNENNQPRGLGVWFPFDYGEFKRWYSDYLTLEFSKESSWGSLLYNYYNIFDLKPLPVNLTNTSIGMENEFTISWMSSFSFLPVTYRLYSFTASETILFDSCHQFQSWEGDWTIAGRFHSPPSSFFSGNGVNLNRSLVLKEPLSLPEGGILSFFAYYETEENYAEERVKRDILYIEFSRDGMNWEKIDSLYGRNLTWRNFSYLLPPAPSLWIRFRYQTDETLNLLGVFIDDIVILSLLNLKRYGLEIKDTFFFVFNHPEGSYHFFVIPCDSCGNQGLLSPFLFLRIENPCRPFSFPSPFSQTTKIFLDVEEGRRGELYIIDILGRIKRILPFRGKEVLFDRKDFTGKRLPSGVYLLFFQGGKGGKITMVGR